MCFSATASLTAGVLLVGIGAACVARASCVRSLPVAAMPMIFGLQQLTEGGLWLSLESGDTALEGCFSTAFSFFAQVLWPIYVPVAVWLIEPDRYRRIAIAACGAGGLAVAALLLKGLVSVPVIATISGAHIHYRSVHIDSIYNAGLFVPATIMYVVATCLSPVLSHDRIIRAIGVAMAAAFAVSYFFYEEWLVSVWCFFAAALSALVWRWVAGRTSAMAVIPQARTS